MQLDKTGRHVFHFELPETHTRKDADVILWSTSSYQEAVNLPPSGDFLKLHSDLPLGNMKGGLGTLFRLFAPRADAVEVVTFSKLDESDKVSTLVRRVPYGIWEVDVSDVSEGMYYYFHVIGENRDTSTAFEEDFKIMDPYALAMVSAAGLYC